MADAVFSLNFTFFEMVYKFHTLAYELEAEMVRLFNEQILALTLSMVTLSGLESHRSLADSWCTWSFSLGQKWNPTKKMLNRRRSIYPLDLWNR